MFKVHLSHHIGNDDFRYDYEGRDIVDYNLIDEPLPDEAEDFIAEWAESLNWGNRYGWTTVNTDREKGPHWGAWRWELSVNETIEKDEYWLNKAKVALKRMPTYARKIGISFDTNWTYGKAKRNCPDCHGDGIILYHMKGCFEGDRPFLRLRCCCTIITKYQDKKERRKLCLLRRI